MGYDILRALIGLIICIGLILVVAALLRKHKDKLDRIFSANFLVKPAARRLKSIERLQLAPGHVAVLLTKDGVEHLIVLSPQSSQTIESAPATLPVSEEADDQS